MNLMRLLNEKLSIQVSFGFLLLNTQALGYDTRL